MENSSNVGENESSMIQEKLRHRLEAKNILDVIRKPWTSEAEYLEVGINDKFL